MMSKARAVRVARQLLLLVFDALATILAVRAALWLRFDGHVPPPYLDSLPRVLPLLVGTRIVCNAAAGLHRWSFRLAGFHDALRMLLASSGGSVLFLLLWWGVGPLSLPRTVVVLEFFHSTMLFGIARFGPRLAFQWLRLAQGWTAAEKTLIIGDGSSAELLARDLARRPDGRLRVVGLVSDNSEVQGAWRGGLRVLGTVADLPALVRRHEVKTVLLAEWCRSPERIRRIVETCGECRVGFKIVPAPLDESKRHSWNVLDDVSPEDLLPRDSVAFDEGVLRPLVQGRRALVTGAGGSIGSELCRQLARFGVEQLVMVDVNENELYLGARRLSSQFPQVQLRTEVADIREAGPVRRLGERYRPQDVFHAAAHKHVPLMEISPDEAVKNNVFGTLHAAQMAHGCGAERFVLISTDKAVKPSSVMGATKRVAELVVRHIGRSSPTRMTAVRFGNVLGSAGSVLPIFKEQIARGGPVTVTDPECTRYFMTISEAVGLTLIAGLGGYGDLCVLDMGQPIRIADLARYMITLSGRAGDVSIAYMGLRPGEKLSEEVLTEEEEHSHVVRNRIRVAHSPPPPPDFEAWLGELRRLAEAGDRAALLSVLGALVPTYRSTRNVVDVHRLALPAAERAAARGGNGARLTNPAAAAPLGGA